ncbi:testisin-like [Poecilia reticulata]|uniref:testisin-like n=1 Tax=Poecilia reticulata TaxID=8081 RepID=UPI0004A29CC0|nr:PREDICTED: testisin-like [Poecilia reticulata]
MASKALLPILALLNFLCAGSDAQLNECGFAPRNPKIVGGQDASPGSWPWQVELQLNGQFKCGGSLINKKWVLTAAHCIEDPAPSMWKVILGQQNQRDRDTKTVVERNIGKIIVHPKFSQTTIDNDIALLRLSSPVEFTDYIRPVCLAASGSRFNNGTDSWVTGWGNVGEGEPLPRPQTLQEVKVPVIGNRQCSCLLRTVTDNMICAGVLSGGKDSCEGDSGGPMVSKQRSRWIQSGVVSFGFGCAQPNLPGVYTRVSRYQSWIKARIRFNKPGFVEFTSRGEDPDSSFTCQRSSPVTK